MLNTIQQIEVRRKRPDRGLSDGGASSRGSASSVCFGHLDPVGGGAAGAAPNGNGSPSRPSQASLRQTATFTRLSHKQKYLKVSRDRGSFQTPKSESLDAVELQKAGDIQGQEQSREGEAPKKPLRNHGLDSRTNLNSGLNNYNNSIFSDLPQPGATFS